jgi:hypothetical protein
MLTAPGAPLEEGRIARRVWALAARLLAPRTCNEEHERPWHVTAYDYRTASKRHDIVEATGTTEAEALRDLAELLRGWIVERTEGRPPM